jgi:hypothetical protein
LKPNGESFRVYQAAEQPRKGGPLRDETPAIGRDPRQHVPGADDHAVAVLNCDGPTVPQGVAQPSGRGGSTGEAETLAQGFCGVD